MHGAAYLWVVDHAPDNPGHVLDIGGRDVNGSPRPAIPGATSWTALDVAPGPGVDIVADAAIWVPDRRYDLVLCLETFEHTASWRQILATIRKALAPGGYAILTMAGPGRAPHSAIDGQQLRAGEHYGNISVHDLVVACEEAGFKTIHAETLGADTRAVIW